MSIINCPRCNKSISNQASKCPHCSTDLSLNNLDCPECNAVSLDNTNNCELCDPILHRSAIRNTQPVTIKAKIKNIFFQLIYNKCYLFVAIAALIILIFVIILINTSNCSSVSQNSVSELKSAQIGDTIEFGKYEQDNIFDNGTEPIEWVVADKTDDKILVISTKIIDCQVYHPSDGQISWEECTLRIWLNSTFTEKAFTLDERSYICQSELDSYACYQKYYNNELGTWKELAYPSPGCTTYDQVFILSTEEIDKYLPETNTYRCASPSNYALINAGASSPFSYWTRSYGVTIETQRGVNNEGSWKSAGYSISSPLGVRPCLWIDIS